MDAVGFKQWLQANESGKKAKLYTDCVSRASRVERAFQEIDANFSFESEFAKDKGEHFKKAISRRGVEIKAPVSLPLGTNQMDSIASSVKKYFKYLESK